MKLPKISLPLLMIIYLVVLFIGLWFVWYHCYYYVLLWLEGYSYYSDLSDLTFLASTLPDDICKIIGSYLLQFYYYPVAGAAIQATFPMLIMLCGMWVTVRLFRNAKGLLWLSLIPVVVFLFHQFWDTSLKDSILWCAASLALAIVVELATLRHRQPLHLPSFLGNKLLSAVASLALFGLSVYNLGFKDERNYIHHYYCQLEYLANERQWDELLRVVTPRHAQESFIARRYALLALNAKGLLAEKMFTYGVMSDADFLFVDRDEPLCHSFNAVLFRELGMPNEVIHHSFQEQAQSNFGISFNILRRLTETCLETKNYPLAKKYLDILSHSTVMKHWAEEHRPQLEAIRHAKPNYEINGEQFFSNDFLVTMGAMCDRYPQNRMYADYLLCGLLARKDGNEFYPAFQIVASRQYAHGERLPHYYEEALMLLAPQKPEIMEKYNISKEVREAFFDAMRMVKAGETGRLKTIIPNSYWAYFF
ncbi:MAG: DUF6057 family protein [Prevotella sp.]